jgi:hypothetical protein
LKGFCGAEWRKAEGLAVEDAVATVEVVVLWVSGTREGGGGDYSRRDAVLLVWAEGRILSGVFGMHVWDQAKSLGFVSIGK